MKVRFLLDENEPPRLKAALLRLNSTIDVLRVGDPGAPPLGTPDPDLLRYLELSQRAFVTSNRTSVPPYLQAHWASGGHVWGVFYARAGTPVAWLARDLLLVWEASDAEEWIDRVNWLPF